MSGANDNTQRLRLARLLSLLDEMAPFRLAADWDNVGLMAGDPAQEVRAILVALDPTAGALDEARRRGCDTLLTHHPAIFRPLSRLDLSDPTGALIAQAVRTGMAVVGCHTNLDLVAHGVSGALAARLDLVDGRPLEETGEGVGFGLVGRLAAPASGGAFLHRVRQALAVEVLKVAGPLPERVERVAVCGGSGSDLAGAARAAGAQVYVTGEVKHAVARWAEAVGFCLVDGGHFATERVVLEPWAAALAGRLQEGGFDVPVLVAEEEHDVFRFVGTGEATGEG